MNDDNKRPFNGELCQPLNPDIKYGEICVKRFLDEGITLSLRPLSLPADEPLLRQFAILELPGRKELEEALFRTKKEELGLLILSDLGQSFMGFIDEQPAFLVTIYRVQQSSLGRRYAEQPGDYKIRLERLPMVGGRDSDVFAPAIWQACPDCFFAFPEVGRLITTLDILQPGEKQYCRAAGFRPLTRIGVGHDWEELYVHTGRRS
ncbi:MAG: hypothetical protein J0H74_05410 [Chitinophagaceae bacterium]|nr:hypothetical protein [Chitinophagaceae bacterium]